MDTNIVRMEEQSGPSRNILVPELYFLISKFLANGPLQETAKVLARELEHLNVSFFCCCCCWVGCKQMPEWF
ncbi:hypothetical protein pipiens_001880 [Culex pipiens pipiens]|uniref:BRWD/PHIP N-terminal domain-containing protein n=1 Tax=Culex pipiens pipiens TaxID=38569 RepID=A0ABD1DRD0_CULPP